MTLTEAYERLKNARDLNGILPGDAVDVILNAKCGNCAHLRVYTRSQECTNWKPALSVRKTHGCLAWQAKETA